jgi:hypothetical protein
MESSWGRGQAEPDDPRAQSSDFTLDLEIGLSRHKESTKVACVMGSKTRPSVANPTGFVYFTNVPLTLFDIYGGSANIKSPSPQSFKVREKSLVRSDAVFNASEVALKSSVGNRTASFVPIGTLKSPFLLTL